MVTVYCTNKGCDGGAMEMIEEEGDRSEWYSATYECKLCKRRKVHRRDYDSNGLVISDEVEDE